MTDKDIAELRLFDGRDTVQKLLDEIERLRRGDFTEEEFQNLCHRHDEKDACRFAEGCFEYNRKLFGELSLVALVKGEGCG